MNIYVRIYNLSQHNVEDVLHYTDNLNIVEIGAKKDSTGKDSAEPSPTSSTLDKFLKDLKIGDIVFVGLGGKGSKEENRKLLGIVYISGKPEKHDYGENVKVTANAEILERFVDEEGNEVRDWREEWPELESILGRLTSFQIIKPETYPEIFKKIQELLNARKFRRED